MALELSFGKGKEKKPKAAAKSKSDIGLKVMDFFDKNPLMKILIPAILFIILAAVFVFVIFGDGVIMGDVDDVDITIDESAAVDVWNGNSDILKDKELIKLIEDDPLSPDILSTAKYTGYTVGSSGLKAAQVEIGEGDKLVLTLGETVGESEWTVSEITKTYIVFEAGEITKKINRE